MAAIQTAANPKPRAFEWDVVVETRCGIMRGAYGGAERKSGSYLVVGGAYAKTYHFPAERCTLVDPMSDNREAYAEHVAHTYRFVRDGAGCTCTHPDNPARSYQVRQDANGEWSCTCKAFQFDSRHPDRHPDPTCKHILAWSLVNAQH